MKQQTKTSSKVYCGIVTCTKKKLSVKDFFSKLVNSNYREVTGEK